MKVVIFCGGHGTRLWPISRKSFPKPFVPLLNGKSFLQITYARYRKVFSPEEIFISTEYRYLSFVRRQLPEVPKRNIILEPERRDTMAAYGLAAAIVNKYFPGDPVLFSWAKHLISKEAVFLNAVAAAGEYTQKTGLAVSIDSKPAFPSVHNGWVKKGKSLGKVNGSKVFQLEKQVEKPKESFAKKLFASGEWLIHTGYKVWNTEKLLGCFKEFQPSVYEGLAKIADAWDTPRQSKVLKREYSEFTKTSIDYGIFEKLPSDSVVTVEADMGWEDVGISWETYYKGLITPKKSIVEEGGADTQYLDADKNLVIGPKGKMIAVIGVSDVAIIDTPNGLLVCKLTDTQRVKELYEKLEHYYKEYTE